MATTFDYSKIPVNSGLPRDVNVPSTIINSDLLSVTSLASDCFIKQKFSRKLQAYMIGYVNSIYSDYSVYK
jgi:hypothetical protein